MVNLQNKSPEKNFRIYSIIKLDYAYVPFTFTAHIDSEIVESCTRVEPVHCHPLGGC